MAEFMYGQQSPEHDAAGDDTSDQHFQLRSDALHLPSPPRFSFNQNGLPSPFTWEQFYSDHVQSSAALNTPTHGSAPLYHEMGNENVALTHDYDDRDDSVVQRSFPGNSRDNQLHDFELWLLNTPNLHELYAAAYDLPSTSEALGNTSQVDVLAIATTSSADGQSIDPQPQAPVHTHHLPALSMHDAFLTSGPVSSGSTLHTVTHASAVGYNVDLQSPDHIDAAAGLVSHLESPPSMTNASTMSYNAQTGSQHEATQIQPEQMHHLASDIVPTNPMSNILNTLDVTSVGSNSPFDMLLMSESTGNALHLEAQPFSLGASVANFEFDFQPPSEAVTANFGQSTHVLPTTVPTPESNTQNTLDVTDESRASSRSSTQGPTGPSNKRARSDESDASQSSSPSPGSLAGEKKIPCGWQQLFGGPCVKAFDKDQQHDRHILSHLPDTDGTAFFSYMCKICPPSKDQEAIRAAIKTWGKKEEGGFSRNDSCLRHVQRRHAEVSNPEVYVLEVARPWWWPSDLLRTKRYKEDKVGPRPEGEARTWQAYFQDIIRNYPEVVEKPNLPSLDDENHDEDNDESNEDANRTRPVKRQKTKKSTRKSTRS